MPSFENSTTNGNNGDGLTDDTGNNLIQSNVINVRRSCCRQ